MKQNVMTCGFNELVADGNHAAADFALLAPCLITPAEPSMIVGRPGAATKSLEDGGRTLVLPLPADCPKFYACLNETGGATLMLAEEY